MDNTPAEEPEVDGRARFPDSVIVCAKKLPLLSRCTMRLAVLALVALLPAVAPEATLAPLTPPTAPTTVAPCVPVTSPLKLPVKFVAVPALAMLPFKLPLNV